MIFTKKSRFCLSDENVINILNSKFVPLYANFDAYGFPEGIPAIAKYRTLWKISNTMRSGIATSAVVSPSGMRLLAESGSGFGFFGLWKTTTNYNSNKFLAYLEYALASMQP